jgi:hypothetical protein
VNDENSKSRKEREQKKKIEKANLILIYLNIALSILQLIEKIF